MQRKAKSGVRRATLEATVIRADGTRERLGVISRYEANPLRRAWWRVVDALRRLHA